MSKDHRKIAFFLPNTFTALNIACGFVGILFALKGEYYKACMLIVLGAIFDSVDGRVARMTGTQSSFGEQFDSMSDLISFGIAPALIFYHRFLIDYGRAGMAAAFLFLLCGALRLARFNANIDKVSSDYFQGLPIPGAASAIIGYVLLAEELTMLDNKWSFFPYILVYSLFMISNIPFTSFKKADFVRKYKKRVFFIAILLLVSLFIYEELMIVLVINLYVIFSFLFAIKNRKKLDDIFDWPEEKAQEEKVNDESTSL